MKKTALALSILILTSTFLYNVVGYNLLVSLKKEKSWINAMQNNSTSGYKVFKLNATVYSFMDDTELENVNENIAINNKVYHIFKKKVKDNVIYLYYLPNKQQSVSNLNLKKIVDFDSFETMSGNKKPLDKLFKTTIKDYISTHSFCLEKYSNTKSPVFKNGFYLNRMLHSGYLSVKYSPPKTT